jgi:hypothetical protein
VTRDDFIDSWYDRIRTVTTDAVAYLARCETAPTSDGILGDWLRTLVAMRFGPDDVPLIAQLIDKRDPLLQEAGVKLATAALRHVDAADSLEPALARLVSREIDAWVLESLVDLLAYNGQSFASVYEGLVRNHGRTSSGWVIMRNRHIDPWRRVVAMYEQHAIQTLRPGARDLAYLPILERQHGTRGWEPTVRSILLRMGHDPDRHFELLRSLPVRM